MNVPDRTLDGVLAWYSLIHLAPAELDSTLSALRRAIMDEGVLLVGFFDSDGGGEVAPFEHKVARAYRWPVDEFADRLRRAGFVEIDRMRRPAQGPIRPHAALAARAG